ncbi:MAG: hypothetical protein BWY28_01915 [bacterium ADurb.Bin236]|nr:MAG: hypothetical protein BWY28_01915 [bacterium ADurb.Bin236]
MWNLIHAIAINMPDSAVRTRRYAVAVGIGIASGLFFYAAARFVITSIMVLMSHVN